MLFLAAPADPAALNPPQQVRYKAYQPGGPVAKMLSENPTVLIVNDTVFVHGGLTMQHSEHDRPASWPGRLPWSTQRPAGPGGHAGSPSALPAWHQRSCGWAPADGLLRMGCCA